MVHASTMALIEAAGMDPSDYVERTLRHLSYRTTAGVGDQSSRLVDMPGMPAHTGGYFDRPPNGVALMNAIDLAEGVRLLTHAPGEPCSMLMRRTLLPDTLATALEGRRLDEVVDHAATRVDGLVVTRIETNPQPHAGMIRLHLGRAAWRMVETEI